MTPHLLLRSLDLRIACYFFPSSLLLWITFLAMHFLPSMFPNGVLSIPLLLEKTAAFYSTLHGLFLISHLFFFFLYIYKPSTSWHFPSALSYILWLWPRKLAILSQALLGKSLRKANLLLGRSPRALKCLLCCMCIDNNWCATPAFVLSVSFMQDHGLISTAEILLSHYYCSTYFLSSNFPEFNK